MTLAARLDAAIKLACPIFGVSIGSEADRLTWAVQFAPEATTQQRAAAQAVIDAFNQADPPANYGGVKEQQIRALQAMAVEDPIVARILELKEAGLI